MTTRSPEQILAEFGAELRAAQPRRRPGMRHAAVALALAAAAAAAVVVPNRGSPEREAAATPAAPTSLIPHEPGMRRLDAVRLDLLAALRDPRWKDGLPPDAALVRAWSVPELASTVFLTRSPGLSCLSAAPAAGRRHGAVCAADGGAVRLWLGSRHLVVHAEDPPGLSVVAYPRESQRRMQPSCEDVRGARGQVGRLLPCEGRGS